MRPSVVRLIAFLLPLACLAQAPTIGLVEVFGARKTPPAAIRKVAGVAPGARLPSSKTLVEERLQDIEGVTAASLEAACCEAGKVILYIGIREAGDQAGPLRDQPSDALEMPEAVALAYSDFLHHVREAGRAGDASEDLTEGHSLLSNPGARKAQMAFIPLADSHAERLRDILRRAADNDSRAMAAYVLGYHPDKKAVAEDLAFALSDPDATVRGNAARALGAIAAYAEANPAQAIPFQSAWFVDLLNSPVWTDRNNAAVALVNLTVSRKPDILRQVRQGALPALVEMARWKHHQHALPAYILLGRSGGIPEAELQAAWSKGERERIIARAARAGIR